MKVEYHPYSAIDLNEAVAYYNSQRLGLGDALRIEVYRTIEQILANPEQHRVVEQNIRRCFVHRFPYTVLYRIIDTDLLRILVIRHHRRNPSFGLRRR